MKESVLIFERFVVKHYDRRDLLEREAEIIRFLEKFLKNLKVPEIIYKGRNFLVLKRIKGHHPREEFIEVSLKIFEEIHRKVSMEYKCREGVFEVPKSLTSILNIDLELKDVKPEDRIFVHGDYSFEHVIINLEIYLLDFERSGLGDPNIDYAYLYMESWRLGLERDAVDVLGGLKHFDKESFLFFCLYYSYRNLENTNYSEFAKRIMKKRIKFLLRNL